MDTMYAITRIMQSGPFTAEGFRYFLDYDGTRWFVMRSPLLPDGGYDAANAERFCDFAL